MSSRNTIRAHVGSADIIGATTRLPDFETLGEEQGLDIVCTRNRKRHRPHSYFFKENINDAP